MAPAPFQVIPKKETQSPTLLPSEPWRSDLAKEIRAVYSDPLAISQYIKINNEGVTEAEAAVYKKYLKTDGLCLDIGCGTGRVTLPLLVHGINIIGMDMTKEMLFEAQNQAVLKQLKPRFTVGDWRHLIFKDETFDTIVVNRHVFQHFHKDDRLLMLKEAGRVLKKDGTLILHITNSDHLFCFPCSLFFLTRSFLKLKKMVLSSNVPLIKNSSIANVFRIPKFEQLALFYLQGLSTYLPSLWLDIPRKMMKKLLGQNYKGLPPRGRITKTSRGNKLFNHIPYYVFFADEAILEIHEAGLAVIEYDSSWELAFQEKLPGFLRSHAPESYFVIRKSPHINFNVQADFMNTGLNNITTAGLSRTEWQILRMISNSMKPMCMAGDKLYVKRIEFTDLNIGDVVIIRLQNQLIAHRIVEIKDNERLVTKGDCWPAVDGMIAFRDVVAKVVGIDTGNLKVNLEGRWINHINALLARISYAQVKIKPENAQQFIFKTALFLIYLVHPLLLRFYFPQRNRRILAEKILCLLCENNGDGYHSDEVSPFLVNYQHWPYLYSFILYNRVGPLVYKNVLGGNSKPFLFHHIPVWVIENLKISYQESCSNASLIFCDLADILMACRTQQLRVIVLKGIALAEEFYGDIALRPMEDMDMLVLKEDWPALREILERNGFRNKKGLDLLKLEELSPVMMNRHISYENNTGTKLEFKFSLFILDFPDGKESAEYWKRAVPRKISGVETLVLSSEDQLLYLASRMMNVGFKYYLWFNDLTKFIDGNKKLDWEYIVLQARKKKVDFAVFYTLRVLKEKFSVEEIPQKAIDELSPSRYKRFWMDRLFGYRTMGFRAPQKNGRHFEPFLSAYFFMHKFGFGIKGIRRMVDYGLSLLFPPAEYLRCRYEVSKGGTRLKAGLTIRMKLLVKKTLEFPWQWINRF